MSAETTRRCLTCLYWRRLEEDMLMGLCEFERALPELHRLRSEREECDCGGYVFGCRRKPYKGRYATDFIPDVSR